MANIFKLPWQLISKLTPELGGHPVYVWNGEVMLFATWRYGFSLDEDIDTNEPLWCGEGSIALSPQPTHYLPLSPPSKD